MENNKRPTQVEKIKSYMERFGSITTFEAFTELNIMRLGARISEMRKSGLKIADKQECIQNKLGEKCYIKRYFFDNAEKTLDKHDC